MSRYVIISSVGWLNSLPKDENMTDSGIIIRWGVPVLVMMTCQHGPGYTIIQAPAGMSSNPSTLSLKQSPSHEYRHKGPGVNKITSRLIFFPTRAKHQLIFFPVSKDQMFPFFKEWCMFPPFSFHFLAYLDIFFAFSFLCHWSKSMWSLLPNSPLATPLPVSHILPISKAET